MGNGTPDAKALAAKAWKNRLRVISILLCLASDIEGPYPVGQPGRILFPIAPLRLGTADINIIGPLPSCPFYIVGLRRQGAVIIRIHPAALPSAWSTSSRIASALLTSCLRWAACAKRQPSMACIQASVCRIWKVWSFSMFLHVACHYVLDKGYLMGYVLT